MVRDFSECGYAWKDVVNCKKYVAKAAAKGGYANLRYVYACKYRVVTNVMNGKNVGLLDDTLPWRILCDRC